MHRNDFEHKTKKQSINYPDSVCDIKDHLGVQIGPLSCKIVWIVTIKRMASYLQTLRSNFPEGPSQYLLGLLP